MLPNNTVLELMSPAGFFEGCKEAGFDDLSDFECKCLMKVLVKPELDNAIILNELVLIMENFGLVDQEEEDSDEYFPDTESGDDQPYADNAETNEKPKKRKGKQHSLANIDDKGINIL